MANLIGKKLLDRYEVREHIGRGGMAEVYKVWDNQRNTLLAAKALHEDLAIDRVFMRRFKREAQTLAKLQHPNIVRFYGIERDGPTAFMLLDYIEGKTLKHLLFDSNGPMPDREILKVMRAVCSALQFAHGNGLVHNDIKPGNVMIDQRGNIFLADFGIARMTDAATVTMVGAGTPAYMAPEQIQGEDPVPQTDIYALGIVLFELLTGGERPFTGENATKGGSTTDKVRWEQIYLKPPSPKRWNTKISPELEAVVVRCLEKDPAKRFKTALDFLSALELTLEENVARSQPEPKIFTEPNRYPFPLQRPVWMWGVGLIVLLVGVLALFAGGEDEISFANMPLSATKQPFSKLPTTNNTPIPLSTTVNILVPTIIPTQPPNPTKFLITATIKVQPTKVNVIPKCPGALPSKLNIGDNARVSYTQVSGRSSPGFSAQKEHVLAKNRVVEIIEGPECADSAWWWLIFFSGTISSGDQLEYHSWMPEVDYDTYYLQKVQ